MSICNYVNTRGNRIQQISLADAVMWYRIDGIIFKPTCRQRLSTLVWATSKERARSSILCRPVSFHRLSHLFPQRQLPYYSFNHYCQLDLYNFRVRVKWSNKWNYDHHIKDLFLDASLSLSISVLCWWTLL